ncbi:MAG TPA: hypothetical protein VH593_05000 [Ktedonobacteraceae bacterium]|jgi:hypothetical protein
MDNNLYAQEQYARMRHQAVIRAAERQRLVKQALEVRPTAGEHLLGCLGRALILCGRWLERPEQRKRVAYSPSAAQ